MDHWIFFFFFFSFTLSAEVYGLEAAGRLSSPPHPPTPALTSSLQKAGDKKAGDE